MVIWLQRWQRRFFVLYDDGELTYSVDDNVSVYLDKKISLYQQPLKLKKHVQEGLLNVYIFLYIFTELFVQVIKWWGIIQIFMLCRKGILTLGLMLSHYYFPPPPPLGPPPPKPYPSAPNPTPTPNFLESGPNHARSVPGYSPLPVFVWHHSVKLFHSQLFPVQLHSSHTCILLSLSPPHLHPPSI